MRETYLDWIFKTLVAICIVWFLGVGGLLLSSCATERKLKKKQEGEVTRDGEWGQVLSDEKCKDLVFRTCLEKNKGENNVIEACNIQATVCCEGVDTLRRQIRGTDVGC